MSNATAPDYHSAIVGAGFSGIGAAVTLDKASLHNYLIIEAGDGPGGTWHWNTYPGIAVDVPSFSYQFSFEQSPNWSRTYAAGNKVKAYAEHCVDKYGLRSKIRFNTKVLGADFDDDVLGGRGVTQGPRADLTGDHPARIEAHPHAKIDSVAACDLGRQSVRFLLDGQPSETCSKSVFLHRNRGTKVHHHAVAGVLHSPAVAAHRRRRPCHEVDHNVTQPLDINGGRDVHRPHHVGEQHRHLLVLAGSGDRVIRAPHR